MTSKLVPTRWRFHLLGALSLIAISACTGDNAPADLLLAGGSVLDGAGGEATAFRGSRAWHWGSTGGGSAEVAARLGGWKEDGIGVNAFLFVGHNWVRRQVIGAEDRAPTDEELDAMRDLVRLDMDQGAYGLSSGLFYLPGNYAETEEVVELNAQGAHNYGRAHEGAALIEAARARGVGVAGAHHSHTATQSNLRSYTIPGWAVDGGDAAMVRRFDHPDTVEIIDRQTREMLAIRGGANHLLFADQRPDLNGRTLQPRSRPHPPRHPPSRLRVLHKEDSRPCAGRRAHHAAVHGSFHDGSRGRLPGVAGAGISSRRPSGRHHRPGPGSARRHGHLREPHQYSRGTVHVLVNGVFAIRDGEATMALAGRSLVRGGAAFDGG